MWPVPEDARLSWKIARVRWPDPRTLILKSRPLSIFARRGSAPSRFGATSPKLLLRSEKSKTPNRRASRAPLLAQVDDTPSMSNAISRQLNHRVLAASESSCTRCCEMGPSSHQPKPPQSTRQEAESSSQEERRPRGRGGWKVPTAAGSMPKEAALLLFDSVRANVSTIHRISFACTQGRIETE